MGRLLGAIAVMAVITNVVADTNLLDEEFRRLASDEIVNIGQEYLSLIHI